MQRFNSFYFVHKGLRAMLYDAALTLQQTDFSNKEEAENALSKIDNALFIFDHHAHHEDTFVFPMVEIFEPELSDSFEKEHAEDHRLANCLKNLLAIYDNALLPEEKIICGSAIIKSFVEFMVFNLQHMAKEEVYINQALWKHYSDEQIMETTQKLLASIPPTEMQVIAKWMVHGMSNTDIISWIKGVKQSVPEFAFIGLLKMTKEELGEMRFAVIQEGLKEAIAA